MNIQKEKGESRFATLAPHIPGTRTRELSTLTFSSNKFTPIETSTYSSFPLEGSKHFHQTISHFQRDLGLACKTCLANINSAP